MLLAVDTSTRWIGLALYDSAQVIAETVWRSRNHHTVELAPAIASLLSSNGLKPQQLQGLAVALGPGAFTSLRIGLALVKGMALTLRIPVVGVPTLDVLAAAQPLQEIPLVALLHVGRNRMAANWYSAENGTWVAQSTCELLTLEELAKRITSPTLVCGELDAEARQVLGRKRRNVVLASPAFSLRRPAFLAERAWARWTVGQVDDPLQMEPIYLHSAASATL